jgi:hypothetical protein
MLVSRMSEFSLIGLVNWVFRFGKGCFDGCTLFQFI